MINNYFALLLSCLYCFGLASAAALTVVFCNKSLEFVFADLPLVISGSNSK